MMGTVTKKRFNIVLIIILCFLCLAFLFLNPVRPGERVVEVIQYCDNEQSIEINLSEEQGRTILREVSKCLAVRTLIQNKSEYSEPNVYHVRTDERSLFICFEKGSPVIHTYRHAGSLTDGEWTLYPSAERYEKIVKLLKY